MIATHRYTKTPNHSQMTPFDPLIAKDNEHKPTQCPKSPVRKEWSTSPKDVSSSGTHFALRLRSRTTIAKRKKVAVEVYKRPERIRTSRDVDADFGLFFDDTLGKDMLSKVE